ncbi:hypothetical protein acdb102_32800 [Acidothermaceae bacterium B102]|nr:hypothetical protein acdb102_32800 [Acidothermaceae bacterium B102]
MSSRLRLSAALCAAVAVLTVTSSAGAAGTASKVNTVPGTSCPRFPADNVWHADVSKLPVNKHSKAWLSHMGGAGQRLHPDFGPSYGEQPVPYGIPITVVKKGHAKVKVGFDYASESDKGPYPFGKDTKIEGGVNSGGDMHAIVVDASTCTLYETWDTTEAGTTFHAGSGAIWSLTSDKLRPASWTSADAAGLPIMPGLLSYDEVQSGVVDHAIRFTTNVSDESYVWPARHEAGSVHSAAYPPMGARFRLSKSYHPAGSAPQTLVVLRAMQKYGLILADNGSPWYFQGTADARWSDTVLNQLKSIPASAFVAVDESSLEVSKNSAAVKP